MAQEGLVVPVVLAAQEALVALVVPAAVARYQAREVLAGRVGQLVQVEYLGQTVNLELMVPILN